MVCFNLETFEIFGKHLELIINYAKQFFLLRRNCGLKIKQISDPNRNFLRAFIYAGFTDSFDSRSKYFKKCFYKQKHFRFLEWLLTKIVLKIFRNCPKKPISQRKKRMLFQKRRPGKQNGTSYFYLGNFS